MLRDPPVKTAATFEEYVTLESVSDVRHEFIDGNLFVMAGGSQEHNMVAGALAAVLRPAARARGCRIFASDMIVRVPSGKGFYPDVLVTCNLAMNERHVIHAPSVIVEVLSDSTQIFDRVEKWEQYQQIPSLQQYVLLSQHEIAAEVYSRQDAKWFYERLTGDAILHFSSLEFGVSLRELYEDIPELGQETPPAGSSG